MSIRRFAVLAVSLAILLASVPSYSADQTPRPAAEVLSRVIYVNSAIPAGGDGTSWSTAYHTLKSAVDDISAAGPAEVWVARATYAGKITLPSSCSFYGGFTGGETDRSRRDPNANPTVIDPYYNESMVPWGVGSGCTYVVTMSGGSSIDGFTITRGDVGISAQGVVSITNCRIHGNDLNGISLSDSAVVANCRIYGNGGGISCSYGSPVIVNNDIYANAGAGITCGGSSAAIANNIIAYNKTGVTGSAGSPTLTHNDIYGNETDYSGLSAGTGDISADPKLCYGSYRYGDPHIQLDSPCKDAGTNSVTGLPETDFEGQPRIANGTVDIGVDESDGTSWPSTQRIVYVRSEAPEGGDGTSWPTAYRTIDAAMSDLRTNGGAEVWVARGLFGGTTLAPYAHIFGGFAGTETRRSDRNWRTNRTIISCQGDFIALTTGEISTVDGFTIAGGNTGVSCPGVCDIANNTITGNNWGGISCSATTSIVNNIVSGNGRCGVVCRFGSARLLNNTIVGSDVGVQVGYQSQIFGYDEPGDATLVNNIIAFNETGLDAFGTVTLSHNDVYGNSQQDYVGVSPGDGDISADPLFASYETGDLHVQRGSPCVGAGTDAVLELPALDIDCEPRVQSGGVDIGADESDGTVWVIDERIMYVKASASAGGDGRSWGSAYRTISEAVDDVLLNGGAEVWVAEGFYNETVSLTPFSGFYGGFVGTESDRSQRKPREHPSIIGWEPREAQQLPPILVYASGPCVLDGFTLRNGTYGVLTRGGSPTINCNVVQGSVRTGFEVEGGKPLLTNNVVSGGDYGLWLYSSQAVVTNNTIFGSKVQGIGCSCGPNKITNNIVTGCPIGVYVSAECSDLPVLANNDVFGNMTDYTGIQPGTGDISLDPMLVHPEHGDFHLDPASPCINAGSNAAPGLPTTDFESEGRIWLETVDIGADEFVPVPTTAGAAKKHLPGAWTQIDGYVVTAAFLDFFYIESDDRSAGIRVDKPAHGVSPGQRVNVLGRLGVTADGECCLDGLTITPSGVGTIQPIFLSGRSLAGGSFGLQDAVWGWRWVKQADGTWELVWKPDEGLSNIGLLVMVCGEITQIDPSNRYFYIDDGSRLKDGTKTGEVDNYGVRVESDGSSRRPGEFLAVTGISCCFKRSDGDLRRLVRPVRQESLKPASP